MNAMQFVATARKSRNLVSNCNNNRLVTKTMTNFSFTRMELGENIDMLF
jgi:hypothetical protein